MPKTQTTFEPNPRSILPALGHIALLTLTKKYDMSVEAITLRLHWECTVKSFADRARKVREHLDAYRTMTTVATALGKRDTHAADRVMQEACIYACTLASDYAAGKIPAPLKESVLFNADYVGEMGDLAAAPMETIVLLLTRHSDDHSGK